MFHNTNHKSVLTEKVFDFEKTFSVLFSLKRYRPFFPQSKDEWEKYWRIVYESGNSAALKREIKNLSS
jgi:hypothetical protein